MASTRRSIRHPHQYNGAIPTTPTTPSTTSAAGSNRRQSKATVTVEYHRPSRESIQEYTDLLNDASTHAAAAAAWAPNYEDLIPARAAPPPPAVAPLMTARSKTPTQRNSTTGGATLTKQRPRSRSQPHRDQDPFAAYTNGTAQGGVPPPPRPSRANTATLVDMDLFPPHQPFSPATEEMPYTPFDAPLLPDSSQSTPSSNGTRSRGASSSTKPKKGFLNLLLNTQKRPEISTPYDPVHLTHVGFNSSTGEFTGLPKEWQQLLQESGISRSEQEKNPQAVMEIVKFYQEGVGGDGVWEKMAHGTMGLSVGPTGTGSPAFQSPRPPPPPPPASKKLSISVPTPPTPIAAQYQAASQPAPPVQQQYPQPPQAYRLAPTAPSPASPALDRSASQRVQGKTAAQPSLSRSQTTKDRAGTPTGQTGLTAKPAVGPQVPPKHSPASSTSDLSRPYAPVPPATPAAPPPPPAAQPPPQLQPQPPATPQSQPREAPTSRQQPPAQPSPAAQSLAKHAQAATPRRREKKPGTANDVDIISRLQKICTDADPTRLYRSLVKIGQG